jgi:hypothetical protein
MDSDSDDDQPATKTIDNASKVAKPDLFHGDRHKYEAWILQMDLYFLFSNVPKEKQALFAGTYLRGSAEHWAKPFMKAKLQGDDDANVFKSWEHFKGASATIFGISNEVSQAVRVIQNLRQKGSCAEYAAKFQEYAQLTDWDNVALQEMYRRGLKEEVKDELMRYSARTDSLNLLIQASIEIDDRLYERRMEKKYDGKGRYDPEFRNNNRPNIGKFRPRGQFNRYDNNRRQEPYYGAQPMELDNTQRSARPGGGRGKPGRKPMGGKKNFKCYACDKEGHIAKNCPSKNMVSRREFNFIARTSDADKENVAPHDGPQNENLEPELEEEEGLAENQQEHDLDQLYGDTAQRIIRGEIQMDLSEFISQYYDLLEAIRENPNFSRALVLQMLREVNRYQEMPDSDDDELEQNVDRLRQHASLDWTACYDDSCRVHLPEKENANWYPRAPRNERSIVGITRRPDGSFRTVVDYRRLNEITRQEPRELNMIRFSKYPTPPSTSEKPGSQEPLHAIDESDEETSYLQFMEEEIDDSEEENEATEDDTSNDEDDEPHQDLTNTEVKVQGFPTLFHIINIIQKAQDEIFPVMGNQRYLDAQALDRTLDRVRLAVWSYPLTRSAVDYKDIVRERVPIGSLFSPEGYATPDGCFVSKSMRGTVNLLKGRFHETQLHQHKNAEQVTRLAIQVKQYRDHQPTMLTWYHHNEAPPTVQSMAEEQRHITTSLQATRTWMAKNSSASW